MAAEPWSTADLLDEHGDAALGEGAAGVPVRFGSVTFAPGATAYADEDGLIVLSPPGG